MVMKGVRLFAGAGIAAVALFGAGCTGAGGGSGGGGGAPGETETDVRLRPGSAGEFAFTKADALGQSVSLDVRADVPPLPPRRASLLVDPADITMTPAAGDVEGSAVLTAYFGEFGQADVCEKGTALPEIRLRRAVGGAVTAEPAGVEAPDGILSLLSGGEYELCIALAAMQPGEVMIDSLHLRYVTDDNLAGFSCEQIFALPDVRHALETLNDNDLEFRLFAGNDPGSIEGTYRMRDRVRFDPDGSDTGGVITGAITFADQAGGRVQRRGFNASLEQAIQGSSDNVSVCVLGRSANAECDQTIARLESLTWSESLQAWDGTYLAVVVQRHASTADWCGGEGDFNYGDIRFATQNASTNGTEH